MEDRTWSMMTTKFLPRALFIGRENRVDNGRGGALGFNFDPVEFIFYQPSRVYKNENSRKKKRNPRARETYRMFCWILCT